MSCGHQRRDGRVLWCELSLSGRRRRPVERESGLLSCSVGRTRQTYHFSNETFEGRALSYESMKIKGLVWGLEGGGESCGMGGTDICRYRSRCNLSLRRRLQGCSPGGGRVL